MTRTAFILGGGPRVGNAVANALSKQGFKVAIGRRNPQSEGLAQDIKTVKLDVSDTSSIKQAFNEVQSSLGTPSVVIYNAAAVTRAPSNDDPFSIDTEVLKRNSDVNIFGVYTALQEATKGFKKIDADVQKVFILTGNILPFHPIPPLVSLGLGKTGGTHLIQAAVATEAFAAAGYRFYFASETLKDGGPVYTGLSGDAHARKYLELIEKKEQGPWDVRFVA